MVIFYFLAKLKGFKIKKRKINKIKSGCVVIDAPKHNTLRRELPGTTPARITTPHFLTHHATLINCIHNIRKCYLIYLFSLRKRNKIKESFYFAHTITHHTHPLSRTPMQHSHLKITISYTIPTMGCFVACLHGY